MIRFAIALAVYATRLIVPIVVGATCVGVALALGMFPVFGTASMPEGICGRGWRCLASYPDKLAWQAPVAILIAVVGLGLAALIALWNHRHPAHRPAPSDRADRFARHAQSMLRFQLALAGYSARRALPPVIVVFSIFAPIPFSFATGMVYGADGARSYMIRVALIAVVGLGLAFGLAVWNRWRPQARPLPPLPSGWQTGA